MALAAEMKIPLGDANRRISWDEREAASGVIGRGRRLLVVEFIGSRLTPEVGILCGFLRRGTGT